MSLVAFANHRLSPLLIVNFNTVAQEQTNFIFDFYCSIRRLFLNYLLHFIEPIGCIVSSINFAVVHVILSHLYELQDVLSFLREVFHCLF